MPPEVCVEETAATDPAWDPYVAAHCYGTGCHLLAWRQLVENVFGHRTFYLSAKDGAGRICGVLPLVFLSSRIFGRFLVSLPFVNYGGVLASDSASERALLERAERIARQVGAGHIELRHGAEIGLKWIDRQHNVSMRLALPADSATLAKNFPAKLRSQIRRSRRTSQPNSAARS